MKNQNKNDLLSSRKEICNYINSMCGIYLPHSSFYFYTSKTSLPYIKIGHEITTTKKLVKYWFSAVLLNSFKRYSTMSKVKGWPPQLIRNDCPVEFLDLLKKIWQD